MTEGIGGTLSPFYTQPAPALDNNKSNVSQDEFLTLLTYQLKNQNPLEPYDTQEFSSTLAQFSQLEQLTDMKSLMEEQLEVNSLLGQTMTNSALPGLLGKSAKAMSNVLKYDGENSPNLGFDLPYNVSNGKIKIFDSNNVLINIIELDQQYLSSGEHTYAWDGKDFDGDAVGVGNYYFEAEMRDASGATFSADTFSEGNIEAVRFKNEGTFLVINGVEVSLNKVSGISNS